MKRIWLFMSVIGISLSLMACSGEEGDTAEENVSEDEHIPETLEEEVEIEFWHAMTGALEETLEEMTEDFNAEQKNITVKLVGQGSYGDLSKKLMAAAKADDSPVMSQAYEDWMLQYVENDLITDLTPYIEHNNHGWSKEELEDIIDVFREANTYDEKLFGVPFNKSTEILFYNQEMLKENDVKVPTTWEEYEEAAKNLTSDDVVGLGFENSIGLSFPTYVRQAGGTVINEESNQVAFDTTEAKEALEFLNGLVVDGNARLAGEDGYMSEPFSRADVAMYVGSSAGISFVDAAAEGKVDWFAAPLPKGKEAATAFQGTNLTIFDSASDEEKLAAWEYMKFLTSKEETVRWAMKTGYVPVRLSALELSDWQEFVDENPVFGIATEQFEAGYYDPHIKGKSGINDALTKEIQAVLLGEKTVDEGLYDLQESAQAAVDKANK